MKDIFNSIIDSKLVAILRGLDYDENMKVIELLIESGIRNLEVTLNTKSALDVIRSARKQFDNQACIGAGTVTNEADARNAIAAGAEFLICPNLHEGAIRAAGENNVLIIPGVLTPTEILHARELGCSMVKLFPASCMGSDYIKQLRGPIKDVKIMAVGGVDDSNAKDYFKNGADAIGVGGKLIRMDIIENKDYKALKEHFMSFKKSIE